MAAPRRSANGSKVFWKVSASFNARPPDTTLEADARSGLSDLASSVFTCSVGESTSIGSTSFNSTSETPSPAAPKAVVRTVKNLTLTEDGALTVAIALPA